MTVDRAHVLATPGLDRHSAYVALSRHRDSAQLHYGCDDFADQSRPVRTLSRGRAKDMASDYMRDFADRRAIMLREPSTRQRDIFAGLKLGPVRTSQTGRGMFDGLRLSVAPPNAAPERTPLDRAVERRSEEHTSELQSLMRISYAVF